MKAILLTLVMATTAMAGEPEDILYEGAKKIAAMQAAEEAKANRIYTVPTINMLEVRISALETAAEDARIREAARRAVEE